MKTLLIFMALGFLTAGCSCNNEDDDFTPYPGGKSPKETPKS